MPKDTEQQYQVQKIIDRRCNEGQIEYKVLWKGYFEHEATWQPRGCLLNARKLIKRYEKAERTKRQKTLNKKIVEKRKQELLAIENETSIKNLNQLVKLMGEQPIYHRAVPDVKMGKPKEPLVTFECLLANPQNELLKILRYDYIQGIWKEQLQTNAEIIVKTAARQKHELCLSHQPITINGVTYTNGTYYVHFQKGKAYKCELDLLRLVRPNQVVEYLLERFDPAQQKTKVSREIKEYLKSHPEEDNQWSD